MGFYIIESGGKKSAATKRLFTSLAILFLVGVIVLAWLSPNENHTFYQRTNQSVNHTSGATTKDQGAVPNNPLFTNGQKKMNDEKRAEAEKSKHRVAIKYFAPQVLGQKSNEPRTIRTGSKLLGFLMNAIDTRESSMVRVLLPRGGESSGVEIEAGSILSGQFSYSGSGDKVFINFHRLESATGHLKKIVAQALDSRDFSVGVRGEVQSDNTLKLASQVGLSMFASMAEVLTEKESIGSSQNGIQAKPTMKNGLLQGMSRTAQDQAGRTSSEIQSIKDYVILPEGKEMIIQLTEDFQK
ncbi:MAG: TrbI/VirB10 family protein [Pseudobdellovibrionaceae bacterium]